MSVWTVASSVLGLLPSIFKHKPNAVWRWNGTAWVLMCGPMSARQCRLQIATYVSAGMDRKTFIILRSGAKPPEGFNPPAKGAK